MPGLESLTAVGHEVVIGGKTYRCRPLVRTDWGLIYERIKAGRADPIEIALRLAENASEPVARELLDRAYGDAMKANIVTPRQIEEWMVSPEGLMFQFYLQVRKEHKEIDEDTATELLGQHYEELIKARTDEMLATLPGVTAEDVAQFASQHGEELIAGMIAKAAGLPEGNSPTPRTPGTPTDHSTGSDGTPS